MNTDNNRNRESIIIVKCYEDEAYNLESYRVHISTFITSIS